MKKYIIDEHFCRITQEQIAVAMGMVASLGSGGDAAQALDQLAKIRGFFDRDKLSDYSKKLRVRDKGFMDSSEMTFDR